jgi:hypothetical protein
VQGKNNVIIKTREVPQDFIEIVFNGKAFENRRKDDLERGLIKNIG